MATKKTTITTTTAKPDLSIFSLEVSPSLLAQAIHIYQENSHRGTSKVKTRGELNISKHKVYKQKGTGNARHGAKSAPIYVGGGVVFGPAGLKLAPKSFNQKMKVKALLGMLSLYNKEDRLVLVDSGEVKDSSTKSKVFGEGKAALVHYDETPGFLQAVSNLDNLVLLSARRLNAYTVATSPKIFLTASGFDHLVKRLKLK